MTNEELIQIINKEMEEEEISRYKLSKMIGGSEATLKRNLSGEVEIAKVLLKVCNALDLEIKLRPKKKKK